MRRIIPLLTAFALAFVIAGCAEDQVCAGGVCETEGECIEICEEFCEGEVLDAFCGFDEICTCECEFRCLI